MDQNQAKEIESEIKLLSSGSSQKNKNEQYSKQIKNKVVEEKYL